jgi:prefoldin subunit 5
MSAQVALWIAPLRDRIEKLSTTTASLEQRLAQMDSAIGKQLAYVTAQGKAN